MKLTKEEKALIKLCHREPFQGGITMSTAMAKAGFTIIDMKCLIAKLAPKAKSGRSRK